MTSELTDKEKFDANYRIVKRHLDIMVKSINSEYPEVKFYLEDAISMLQEEVDYVKEMMKHDP